MSKPIPAVRGMNDILAERMPQWQALEANVAEVMAAYGYSEIRTPILEREELFARPVGAETDIVQKELYRYEGSDGTSYCMRPEGTVAVVRALAAGGALQQPAKVWYLGPMFRKERPQKGRLRQFHQFGAELLGIDDPLADLEIIMLCARLWRDFGIADRLELRINNLGSKDERSAFRGRLREFLLENSGSLGEIDLERARTNPLRVLDSKDPAVAELLERAPKLADFVGADSRRHFDAVLEGLAAVGIAHRLDPLLVRGLDYYNLTVYEWIDTSADRRQNAVCGGGRYDGLAELIGARPCPGTGMAAGIERLLDLGSCADGGREEADFFLGTTGDGLPPGELAALADRMRKEGLRVVMEPRRVKIRDLFRHADRSGARYAVVIGAKESAAGTATVKPLRSDAGQMLLSRDEIPSRLAELASPQR